MGNELEASVTINFMANKDENTCWIEKSHSVGFVDTEWKTVPSVVLRLLV